MFGNSTGGVFRHYFTDYFFFFRDFFTIIFRSCSPIDFFKNFNKGFHGNFFNFFFNFLSISFKKHSGILLENRSSRIFWNYVRDSTRSCLRDSFQAFFFSVSSEVLLKKMLKETIDAFHKKRWLLRNYYRYFSRFLGIPGQKSLKQSPNAFLEESLEKYLNKLLDIFLLEFLEEFNEKPLEKF